MTASVYREKKKGLPQKREGLREELPLLYKVNGLAFSLYFSLIRVTMFVSIVLVWICVFFIVLQLKSRRPKNFPPGPFALPILGNALQLNPENPLNDFGRVRKVFN